MRSPSALTLLTFLAPFRLVVGATNITKNESIGPASDTAELGWGVSGSAFGYSAGVGLNFSKDLVAGGYNAAVPGQANGAFGSGWTINETTLEIGFGGYFGNRSVGIAVVQDMATGRVTVVVNGKEVE